MEKIGSVSNGLPLHAQSILEPVARSVFHLFSSISQGRFLVDKTGRIVWVNEDYLRFLPALGLSPVDPFFRRPCDCGELTRPGCAEAGGLVASSPFFSAECFAHPGSALA
jgi:hypothetical protein